jgi:5'-methylthioadenosine phosphorylase
VKVLLSNADKARALVKAAIPRLKDREEACEKGCHHALDHAIITAPDSRDATLVAKLDAVAGRALGG